MRKLGKKGAGYLKIFHLCCIAIWFGGVMSWFPLVFLLDISNAEEARSTYFHLRSIAWNVIGWGGVSSFFSGLMLGTLTKWKLFRHRWVTVKLFTAIGLILYGMFFLEDLMLTNLDLLEKQQVSAVSNPVFLQNHYLIKAGLIVEALVFIGIIAVSVLKARFKRQ